MKHLYNTPTDKTPDTVNRGAVWFPGNSGAVKGTGMGLVCERCSEHPSQMAENPPDPGPITGV